MQRLVCVFVFRTEQSQVFSWRGIGGIKGDLHAQIGGDRWSDLPSGKTQKYRLSKQYWSGSPEKSQSYQASIQCWAIIGTPAKRHLIGVSLEDR